MCIQKICPKILRDHLTVQAASIDSPEKQRLTIENFLQANVHGSGATPMDVDALAKSKRGGKGEDKGGKSKKCDGNCFWCGAYGHMMEDCQKKAAGKPQSPKSREGPIRRRRAKAKVAKARKARHPSTSGQMVRKLSRLMRKLSRRLQVSSERYSQRDWQAWERVQKQAQNQWKSCKSGNLCANAVNAELGERIDLTIDSGCAARAL